MNNLSVTDEVRTFPQLHMPVLLPVGEKGIRHAPKIASKAEQCSIPENAYICEAFQFMLPKDDLLDPQR
jgi:hypothetical protein